MRIPLEILRMIIAHLAYELDVAQIVRLRLVSRGSSRQKGSFRLLIITGTLDQEILPYIFYDHGIEHPTYTDSADGKRTFRVTTLKKKHTRYYERSYWDASQRIEIGKYYARTVTGHEWSRMPWSLRKKYLHYRLKHRQSQPNLFAYLFVPVFERHLLANGIAEHDDRGRDDALDLLLELTSHDARLGCVVAHDPTNFEAAKDYMSRYNSKVGTLDADSDDGRERQTDYDYRYATILLDIVKDDQAALRDKLEGKPVPLMHLNFCFGNSLLEFAIERGSVGVLQVVIEHGWLSPGKKKRLKFSNMFHTVLECKDQKHERMVILTNHFLLMKPERKQPGFVDCSLQHAIQNAHVPIVEFWVDWINEHLKSSPQRDRIFENAFPKALYLGNVAIIERLCAESDINGHYGYYNEAPLQIVLTSGFATTPVVQLLLEKGADVNYTKSRKLPKQDVPLTIPGQHSQQCVAHAVYVAARKGKLDWVELLLKFGAILHCTAENMKLLDWAQEGGSGTKLLRLLQKYGWGIERLASQEDCNARKDIACGFCGKGLLWS